MAVAALGEISSFLKPQQSVEEMLALFLAAVDDVSPEVSSNSIYGLGLLLESTPLDLSR
jgi:hypothetical protein